MTALRVWSQKFRQQFSSGSVYLQSREGVRDLEVDSIGDLWVVGRALCVFRTVPLRNVPKAKMESVVSAQVPLLSPFRNPGFWYCIHDDVAKIWIWDESVRSSQLNDRTREHSVLPEPCVAPKGTEETCLYKSEDGYFAQVWDNGALAADTWWPDMPTEDEWIRFARGVGVDAGKLPDLSSMVYAPLSLWDELGRVGFSTQSLERRWVRAAALVCFLIFSFQATGTMRLLQQYMHLEEEILAVSQLHKESIEIRERAFDSRVQMKQLEALWPDSQLSLLSDVASSLPEGNLGLTKWQLQRSELEFIVGDPTPDLEAYVRGIESVPLLSGVRVEPLTRGGQIKINATVVER